jgi:hypothetical protein
MNLLNTIEYNILFTIVFAIILAIVAGSMVYLRVPPYLIYSVIATISIAYSYITYWSKAQLNAKYHLGLVNVSPYTHLLGRLA